MNVKKRFTSVRLLYTVNINMVMCTVLFWCHRRKDAGLFFESLKLQRIDFFLKLVAASE